MRRVRIKLLSKKLSIVGIIVLLSLYLHPIVGYEYRPGYLRQKSTFADIVFSKTSHVENILGDQAIIYSQLWLPLEDFPNDDPINLTRSRAVNETNARWWYWNEEFSDFVDNDINGILSEKFPNITLPNIYLELNNNISSVNGIPYEEDPRIKAVFDPGISYFTFNVSYLPPSISWQLGFITIEEYLISLEKWEEECTTIEEELSKLWYIDSIEFSEHTTTWSTNPMDEYPFSFIDELLTKLIFGGVTVIGILLIYSINQKRLERKNNEGFVNQLRKKSQYCPNCGSYLSIIEKYCETCGEEIDKEN